MAADAIIVGGGSGIRFGTKKQFISLGGIPLLQRTVHAFENHPCVDQIIVLVPQDDLVLAGRILSGTQKPLKLVEGGKTRQESVWNGLLSLQGSDLVLIHDAVRPFVSSGLISRVIEGIKGYDACIPGLAVPNTLKEVSNGVVVKTIPRAGLYGVQTPQCFLTRSIIAAHTSARGQGIYDATDDSLLIEEIGGHVRLVEGDPLNMKITLKQDVDIAEAILKCRTEPV